MQSRIHSILDEINETCSPTSSKVRCVLDALTANVESELVCCVDSLFTAINSSMDSISAAKKALWLRELVTIAIRMGSKSLQGVLPNFLHPFSPHCIRHASSILTISISLASVLHLLLPDSRLSNLFVSKSGPRSLLYSAHSRKQDQGSLPNWFMAAQQMDKHSYAEGVLRKEGFDLS